MDGSEKIAGHIYDEGRPCFTNATMENSSQFSEMTPVPSSTLRVSRSGVLTEYWDEVIFLIVQSPNHNR